MALCLLAPLPLAAQPLSGVQNLDFESGMAPWYKSGYYIQAELDTRIKRSGAQSLRVTWETNTVSSVVTQGLIPVNESGRFKLHYWVKVEDSSDLQELRFYVTGWKAGSSYAATSAFMYRTPVNGWYEGLTYFELKSGTDSIDVRLSSSRVAVTAWVDDLKITPWVQQLTSPQEVYEYDTSVVEQGAAMVDRFDVVARDHPALVAAAQRYNQLVVQAAEVRAQALRLERAQFYAERGRRSGRKARRAKATRIRGPRGPRGPHGPRGPRKRVGRVQLVKANSSTPSSTRVKQVIEAVDADLGALYTEYGARFLAKQSQQLAGFYAQAADLEAKLAGLQSAFDAQLGGLRRAVGQRGLKRCTQITTPTQRSLDFAPNGAPNQLVIGGHTLDHLDGTALLGLNQVRGSFSSSYWMKLQTTPHFFDFSGLAQHVANRKAAGAENVSITNFLGDKRSQTTPRWFFYEHQQDPDVRWRTPAGRVAPWETYSNGSPLDQQPLNYFNADVMDMTRQMITSLAETFKNDPAVAWYTISPENAGPYFIEGGRSHSTGYNASALASFRAWLMGRYSSIGELNRQWQLNTQGQPGYTSFDDIQPPADLCQVREWARPHPLGYEFQSWRHQSHMDWLKDMYQTFKAADPEKMVFSSHNKLLNSMDQAFEAADIIGFHSGSRQQLFAANTLQSINRYAKKQLGQFETQHSSQEDRRRGMDERTVERSFKRHIYRLTTRGVHVQMWWYAYTKADFISGNWFNPVYDLTTLRYHTGSLPTVKAQLKRLEEVLLTTTTPQAQVVMIEPTTSRLFYGYRFPEDTCAGEMLAMHELMHERGQAYEVLPEGYFLDGKASLKDFKVVILPYMQYFPDGLAKKLAHWVQRGGVLINLGPAGLFDKFGFEQPRFWERLHGGALPTRTSSANTEEWDWRRPQDTENHLVKRLGSGQVITTLHTLRNTTVAQQVAPLLTQAMALKAPRPVRSARGGFELSLHRGARGETYLSVLNPSVDETVSDRIILNQAYSAAVDLDLEGGFPVRLKASGGRSGLEVRLGPCEWTLIQLLR